MAKKADEYTSKEVKERFEATLRGALKTPPKPIKKKAEQKDRYLKRKTPPKRG